MLKRSLFITCSLLSQLAFADLTCYSAIPSPSDCHCSNPLNDSSLFLATSPILYSTEDVKVDGKEPIVLKRLLLNKIRLSQASDHLLEYLELRLFPSMVFSEENSQTMGMLLDKDGKEFTFSFTAPFATFASETSKKDLSTTAVLNFSTDDYIFSNPLATSAHCRVNIKPTGKIIEVADADGSVRIYKKVNRFPYGTFKDARYAKYLSYLLEEEKLPSGNSVFYSYDANFMLTRIETINSQSKTLAWISFQHKPTDTAFIWTLKTSDAKELVLTIPTELKHSSMRLSSGLISSLKTPTQTITYNHHLSEKDLFIVEKTVNEKLVEELTFIQDTPTPNNAYGYPFLKIPSYKIQSIRSFNPQTGTLLQSQSFSHEKTSDGSLLTAVNKDKEKEVYYLSKIGLLSRVDHHKKEGSTIKLHSSTVYSYIETSQGPRVQVESLFDTKGMLLKATSFYYNSEGALVDTKSYLPKKEETAPPKEDKPSKEDLPKPTEEKTVETQEKPAPVEEKVPEPKETLKADPTIITSVEQGSNGKLVKIISNESKQVLSRVTLDNNAIKVREFFEYNEKGLLSKTIKDNGLHEEPQDLSHVTERHIQVISYTNAGKIKQLEDYVYNPQNRQEELLYKVVYKYNSQNLPTQEAHYGSDGDLAYKIVKEYNPQGLLTKEINPEGVETVYQYNSKGECVLESKYNGKLLIQKTYDPQGRLKEELFSGDHLKKEFKNYIFNTTGLKTQETDTRKNVIRYGYDTQGRLTEVQYPSAIVDGKKTSISKKKTYNSQGLVISEINELGEATNTEYNSAGKPVLISYHDGSKERFTYYPDNSIKEHVDQVGTKTVYSYDFLGRVTSKKIYSSDEKFFGEETFQYDSLHLISTKDLAGVVTNFKYDHAGRKIEEETITSSGKEVKRFVYDHLGRLASKTTHCGNQSLRFVYSYNKLGQVIEKKEENDKGRTLLLTKFKYNERGDISHVSKKRGSEKSSLSFEHDALGRIISTTDAEGNVTTITYENIPSNDLGIALRKVVVTYPNQEKLVQIFDSSDRVIAEEKVSKDGSLISKESYTRNALGQVSSMKSESWKDGKYTFTETKIAFDTRQGMRSVTENVGQENQRTYVYWYNPKGQVKKVQKPDGVTVSFTYDALGHTSSIHSSDNSCNYTMQYHPSGTLVNANDPIYSLNISRTVDEKGRVLQEKSAKSIETQSFYDAWGRETLFVLPDHSAIAYLYDEQALSKVVRLSTEGKELYHTSISSYDVLGNTAKIQLPLSMGTLKNSYDKNGDLIEVAHPHFGQEVKGTPSTSAPVTISSRDSLGSYSYEMFSASNHEATLSYTPNGEVSSKTTAEGTTYFSYDALGRMVEASLPSHVRVKFYYDALNRRVAKKVYNANGLLIKSLFYVYDGKEEVASIDMFRATIHELKILGSSSKDGERRSLLAFELEHDLFAPIKDTQGNVACLLLNGTQTPYETYRYLSLESYKVYDKKGKEIPLSQAISPWQYRSMRVDRETGLLYENGKYLDLSQSKWLNTTLKEVISPSHNSAVEPLKGFSKKPY